MEFVIILIWLFIIVGLMALWIWMLIDCIKNESTEGNEKEK